MVADADASTARIVHADLPDGILQTEVEVGGRTHRVISPAVPKPRGRVAVLPSPRVDGDEARVEP
jgi:hypothetical protein